MCVGICVYECGYKHVGKTLFVRIFKNICVLWIYVRKRETKFQAKMKKRGDEIKCGALFVC